MFNVSLSDRLKAAVNTLEQTGSSLQARAIGQGQASQPQSPSSTTAAQSTPSASLARAISPRPAATGGPSTSSPGAEAVSPTRNYSTSQLAENALSGLRKSFHFGRDGQQQGHVRTGSGAVTNGDGAMASSTGPGAGQQELKDITSPTQPSASSRPASPAPTSARFLSTLTGSGSNFALGNDTPSVGGTPSRPRSPNPLGSNLAGRAQLPAPNPNDPASYPLPPSPGPVSSSLPLLSPAPPSAFADPLGASPSLQPQVPPDPPVLGLHAPTPEDTSEDVVPPEVQSLSLDTAAPVAEVETAVVKVEEAAKRYEGELPSLMGPPGLALIRW